MRRRLALLIGLVVVASACGTGSRPVLTDVALEAPTETSSPSSTTSTTEVARRSKVAEARGQTIEVYEASTGDAIDRTLDRANEVSGKLVFLVKDETADRFEVFLPVRPNGSTGWVDRDDVTVTTHGFRIEVSLGGHNIKVYNGDILLLDTAIAVGTRDTPTPGGVFYLKELLQPPNPDSVYGTYAYGLSGFSNVLESFAGGNGVIGIHGTNDPSVIGSDVSAGCIRLTNDDINRLVEEVGLPLGTPVEILE